VWLGKMMRVLSVLPPPGAVDPRLGAHKQAGGVQQRADADGAVMMADHLTSDGNSRDVGQRGQQGQQRQQRQ
jgi:hypothetical protein